MRQTRSTIRKRIIQQILTQAAGAPILLEELRWLVMQKEREEEELPVGTMTVSYQKSFNRSLRSFLPKLGPQRSASTSSRAMMAGPLVCWLGSQFTGSLSTNCSIGS
jgi:hypothetical protein